MASKHPEMWGTLLFWEFNKGHLTQMSNARALAQGLTTRPIGVTLADSLRPYQQQTDIVTGYRPKPDHSGFEQVRVPWATYLERERETLESWRARRPEPT